MRGDVVDREVAVDPRIAERRRQVAYDRRRRILRRLGPVAVVVLLAAGAYGLSQTAAMDVDQVVVDGSVRSDPVAVAAASGIRSGDPLLGLDAGAIESAVEALPWVADATLSRTWRSGTATLTIVERTPSAIVRTPEGMMVVDPSGRVLEFAPPGVALLHGGGLAVVEGLPAAPAGTTLGPEVAAPLAVVAALTPGVRSRVEVVRAVGEQVELQLQPDGTVELGRPVDLAEKVQTLQSVLAEVDLSCLAVVDVRVPDTGVLTRVPSCA